MAQTKAENGVTGTISDGVDGAPPERVEKVHGPVLMIGVGVA